MNPFDYIYIPKAEEVYLNMHRLVQRHFKPKEKEENNNEKT